MPREPECQLPGAESVAADRTLLAQGWTRRFLADAARSAEALELYRSMGLEVRAEIPAPEDLGPSCAGCAGTLCKSYRMIYTRQRNTQ